MLQVMTISPSEWSASSSRRKGCYGIDADVQIVQAPDFNVLHIIHPYFTDFHRSVVPLVSRATQDLKNAIAKPQISELIRSYFLHQMTDVALRDPQLTSRLFYHFTVQYSQSTQLR